MSRKEFKIERERERERVYFKTNNIGICKKSKKSMEKTFKSQRGLQIIVFLSRQWLFGSESEIVLVLLESAGVDLDFGRHQCRGGNEFQGRLSSDFSSEPEEGLLKVIVAFCRDVIVLQILLAMESDGFSFNFAFL